MTDVQVVCELPKFFDAGRPTIYLSKAVHRCTALFMGETGIKARISE
jgi:hypothetical protein